MPRLPDDARIWCVGYARTRCVEYSGTRVRTREPKVALFTTHRNRCATQRRGTSEYPFVPRCKRAHEKVRDATGEPVNGTVTTSEIEVVITNRGIMPPTAHNLARTWMSDKANSRKLRGIKRAGAVRDPGLGTILANYAQATRMAILPRV